MSEWFNFLRWSGVAIALLLPVVCGVIIAKRPQGRGASISLHFGAHKDTYLFMGLFLTFAGALFYSFIWFWIVPTYNLPPMLYPVLTISYIAQLLLSWWPASITNKKSHTIHMVGGVIVASSMVLLLALLSFHFRHLPELSGLYIALGTITTVLCLLIYALNKQLHQHFLIFELLFIAFFCSALILLALKI